MTGTDRTRLHLHPVPPTAARPTPVERPVFDIEAIEAALAASAPGSVTPLVVPPFHPRPARDLATRHELYAAARHQARDRTLARFVALAGAAGSVIVAIILAVTR